MASRESWKKTPPSTNNRVLTLHLVRLVNKPAVAAAAAAHTWYVPQEVVQRPPGAVLHFEVEVHAVLERREQGGHEGVAGIHHYLPLHVHPLHVLLVLRLPLDLK